MAATVSGAVAAAALRTPDSCFVGLPDFDYPPCYLELSDAEFSALRMHYVSVGSAGVNAPTVLMLHGEPSWSFAWRKVLSALSAAGVCAVAPDHIGFGRSDKLRRREDYSCQRHVAWMCQCVEVLDLRQVVLLCQDWGGAIGLRVLAAMPERFVGVVATNTLLPNCEPPPRGVADWPGELIDQWVSFAADAKDLAVADIVAGASVSSLPEEVKRAYDAPFPDATYQAGALAFPGLIPLREDMPGAAENRAAWRVLEQWEQPFVTAFSDGDPTTKAWETVFQARVPGAQGQPHVEIGDAGHFVQEEQGGALAEVVLDLLRRL